VAAQLTSQRGCVQVVGRVPGAIGPALHVGVPSRADPTKLSSEGVHPYDLWHGTLSW